MIKKPKKNEKNYLPFSRRPAMLGKILRREAQVPKKQGTSDIHDLFVIGGGINGCGIARDAAGRGLDVVLAEMGDLASATSSASTKLFHGGLRYLEYFEFRLVREALIEREVLLRAMPHISWPMRFVLPYHKDMRFESDTPTSRLLNVFMPWMKGRRPAWLIRLGLFLYDSLGGRKICQELRRLICGKRLKVARSTIALSVPTNIPIAGWKTPDWSC
jgi:glycerol-3-phosphate dehydrogenase